MTSSSWQWETLPDPFYGLEGKQKTVALRRRWGKVARPKNAQIWPHWCGQIQLMVGFSLRHLLPTAHRRHQRCRLNQRRRLCFGLKHHHQVVSRLFGLDRLEAGLVLRGGRRSLFMTTTLQLQASQRYPECAGLPFNTFEVGNGDAYNPNP